MYGEKAILATEARELQSRLLNLSDERDKALAALEEVVTNVYLCVCVLLWSVTNRIEVFY